MQTLPLTTAMHISAIEAATAMTELEVHGLWADYGKGDVLQDVELTVLRGESVRLTGRNGSGKSTLLNCVAGSHKPRAGSILIGGVSLIERPIEAKRMLGMSTGTCPFPYPPAASTWP